MIYKHYKGGLYTVLDESVKFEPTSEVCVAYRCMTTLQIWVRPYDMFHGYLEDGTTKRFTQM